MAAVCERTDGNPLLVTELARLLLFDPRFSPEDPSAAQAAALPAGVHDLVGERVRLLSPA